MRAADKFNSEENETLRELILGTVLWGIIFGLITVWFAEGRLVFIASLAAGVLGAVLTAWHMNRSVEYAMEMPQDAAAKYMGKQTVVRMGGAVLLVLAAYFLQGNVIAIFLGLLALKPGAYVQPLIHRLRKKQS